MGSILRMKYVKKMSIFAGFIFSAAFLQACGNKVDCNNSEVKDDVVTIIQEQLGKALWYREMSMGIAEEVSLINIKTISHNEQLKQSQCNGTYVYTYNGKQREANVDYELAYLEDSGKVETKANVTEVVSALMSTAMRELPVKNGVENLRDSAGKLERKLLWKNGKLDGEQVFYYPENGNIRGTQMVVNGVKSGPEKGWGKDGKNLLIDLNWVDGKASGFQKGVDDDGKLITDLVFKDGKSTGVQTVTQSYFYDQYTFKDGLLHGSHRRFSNMSGSKHQIELEENYVNGKLDGVVRIYSNGNVDREKFYKDGEEVSKVNNLANTQEDTNACVTKKIDAFRKGNGEEAPINNDVLEEWTQACTKS